MTKHEFTLVFSGNPEDESTIERLYEAGCDDATFRSVDELGFADFHREADSFVKALASAFAAVEGVSGLLVLHVEPDDLVMMSDIAHRLGKSREYIRLLVRGDRGPGHFPSPVSHLSGRSKLWRWSDVAAWAGLIDEEAHERARVIAAVNGALELRRADLPADEREQVVSAVGTHAPAAAAV